jgi:hypothetical protein
MDTVIYAHGTTQVDVASFEKFALNVPFEQRTRYLMLKMALEHDSDFPALCEKAGLNRWRMRKFFLSDGDISLRPIAEWAWACDKRLEFSAVKRKEAE